MRNHESWGEDIQIDRERRLEQEEQLESSQMGDKTPSGQSSRSWLKMAGRYARPDNRIAWIELCATLGACTGLCVLALFGWRWHPALGIALTPTVALTLVRLFVIQHDCGHGAFFESRFMNDFAGRALSIITLFPYDQWRANHAKHHASIGDLDRRGMGDVRTITLSEYSNLSRGYRFLYRVYRNPLTIIGLGGPFYALILNRIPRHAPGTVRRWRGVSCHSLNLSLLLALFLLWHAGIMESFLSMWLPAASLAACIGVAIFFSGHQFENAYWARKPAWNLADASLAGSAFLAVPEPWGWITGYVGVHHVHHLNSRIPFYRIPDCLSENPELLQINRTTLREALAATRLALWDEELERLIPIPNG
jgi:omega-6 fatty acid desaturase (delta-12 desaturase)